MNIGKSFTFMFDDDKWVEKLVIGALLTLASIIPLVNLFTGLVLAGYTLRLLRNVAEGNKTPLPAWDDWGGDWIKGLMTALAFAIWSIPAWLASGVGALVATVARDSDVVGICQVAVGCLSSLWGLVVGVVLPAGIIKYAMNGEFASFFRLGDMFRFIGDHLGNYIVAVLLGWVAQVVALFGLMGCVIGVFFTVFWASLVSGHLLGQVQLEAAGAAAPVVASVPPAITYGELDETKLGQPPEEPKDE